MPFNGRTGGPTLPRMSAPSRARVLGWVVPIALGLLAIPVLAVAGYALSYLNGDPKTAAKVGDCLSGRDEDDLTVVDCSDPSVTYRVVGRLEDQTQSVVLRGTACQSIPDTDEAVWLGSDGGGYRTGVVLCLAERAKG